MRVVTCFFLIAISIALPSCKERRQSSDLKGHFESGDASKLESATGKQKIVPEYAPAQAVLVSEHLIYPKTGKPRKFDLISAIVGAGADVWLLASNDVLIKRKMTLSGLRPDELEHVKVLRVPTDSYWIRDYGPLVAAPTDGSRAPVYINTNYSVDQEGDESAPRRLAALVGAKVLSLPVYGYHGNIMCNRANCFASSKLVEDDASYSDGQEKVYSQQEIVKFYTDATGVPLVIVPKMPYEATGHIDIWAKLLDDKHVVIADLSKLTIKTSYATEKEFGVAGEISDFLNARAKDFSQMGFQVARIPLPAPQFKFLAKGDVTSIFRSYINALSLNKFMLVPRFLKPATTVKETLDHYPDEILIDGYEKEVEQVFLKAGFTVRWINFDDTVGFSGALHCATMQIPNL
jgi:agmatine/peptidylarginine deiminase